MNLLSLSAIALRAKADKPRDAFHWSPAKKLLLIMKFLTILILSASLHLSAKTFSQKITIVGKNLSLQSVFTSIERQTDYEIVYSNSVLSNSRSVDLDIKNEDLQEALSKVLFGQKLIYTIKEKFIVISVDKTPTPDLSEKLDKQGLSPVLESPPVSGIVRGPDGQPLAGVNVQLKGTNKGTITDINGRFSIDVENGKTIVISNIGFASKEIKINGENNLIIGLEIATSKLDEIQIIAYGKTSQRYSTGNVSTIKAEEIEKQPVNNPLLALQGRVPGIFIEQSTGFSGAAVKVRIQGQNSILNGSEPFYVIDGVPYAQQPPQNLQGNILGGKSSPSGSPLSFINPADIESIDVLKDADATAIYGSRAASGAILITTKKGKSGNIKVDLNVQTGFGNVTKTLDLLNTSQYLEMRNEAIKNDNIDLNSPPYNATLYKEQVYMDINGLWDTTKSSNWQHEFLKGTARYTNVQGSISGGNNNTQFTAGGGFNRQTTIYPGSFSDTKGSLHFMLNSSSNNKKFNFQLSGNYLADLNQLPATDLTYAAVTLAPTAPTPLNADGTINWGTAPSGTSTFYQNPLVSLLSKYKNKTNNAVASASIGYEILPGLEIKSSFGYTHTQTNEKVISPNTAVSPEWRTRVNNRGIFFTNSTVNVWNIEPQINFRRTIGNGKFEALIGTTIQQSNNDYIQLYGTGQRTDLLLEDFGSATNIQGWGSSISVYKYNAVFGRLNYNWQDKYILSLNARRDGSSRFGSENLFHNFGSVGMAWLFTNEKFTQHILPFLSFGKLRASYGTTGNDQIGDYRYLSLYYSGSLSVPYQNTAFLQPSGLTNPYLQWEETRKLSTSLDLGLFKDRILINTTYFQNRCSNQLLGYKLASFAGFTNITRNFPATVQNSGWELSLSTKNIDTKNFSWISSFNFTAYKNKLIAFPNLETSSYARFLVIGKSINVQQLYHMVGVDPETGIYQFADKKGSATFDPVPWYYADNDATVLLNPDPKFYGGFQNTFQYKGLELDVLFQFVKQIGRNYIYDYIPGSSNMNMPTVVLDRWQKTGDRAPFQKYSSNLSVYNAAMNAKASDAAWIDASYIRLKNLSLSWMLPEGWMKNIHFRNAKIYIQGQNLITFSNYLGLDPETRSSITLPPLRILTAGFKIGI